MARETRDVADAMGFSVVFIARDDDDLSAFGEYGDVVLETDAGQFKDIPCVIGIGEGSTRRKIASRYSGEIEFINLVHPSATFGKHQRETLDAKKGVIICAGVRFSSNIAIGDFTIFNLNSSVSHDCMIGDFATISPQACILGNVTVGNGAWIGAGVVLNQGSNDSTRVIGSNTIIGSGAVVLDNCEADSIYVGIPARKIA
jgi:sugar O-acyltransferase (sialic acid O-acetyltransferase NeuD family)